MQAYYPTIDGIWPEHGSQDYLETLLETTTKYNQYSRDFVLSPKLKETDRADRPIHIENCKSLIQFILQSQYGTTI